MNKQRAIVIVCWLGWLATTSVGLYADTNHAGIYFSKKSYIETPLPNYEKS